MDLKIFQWRIGINPILLTHEDVIFNKSELLFLNVEEETTPSPLEMAIA